ncbi:MAG: quinoprotein relay system zinc metallohydrolase 2 [Rhodobacteraceae bacterium]|nr:quinoprotein relay system zinc metallohydrolase 2 [Paracoccaceae bacterium]
MFEAIISLCLSLHPESCRDQLIPGYEAPSQSQCAASLAGRPPDISLPTGVFANGAPECQAVGQALEFTEIAPGVFAHLGRIAEPSSENAGDAANLGFIIGAERVAVIDTGSARWMGEAIWRAVRQHTNRPVTDVILTHMHPDHVLGASVFTEAGARVHGHAGLDRALADRRSNYLESFERLIGSQAFIGTKVARVTHPVTTETVIDLGGRRLVLRPWSLAHSPTDLTVLDEVNGTLFAGDLVFDRHVPTLDGSVRGWLRVLDELSLIAASHVVPGHGGPVLDWPQGAENTRRYLETLARDTRAAIVRGERLGEAVLHIAQDEAAQWQLFESYNPRNATVAFTELEWE